MIIRLIGLAILNHINNLIIRKVELMKIEINQIKTNKKHIPVNIIKPADMRYEEI